MSELSKRYAMGLYSLIENEKDFLTYKDEARLLLDLVRENPGWKATLNSSFLTRSEKHDIINQTLSAFHPYFRHFLLLITDNHRIMEIEDILYDFISDINEKIGIKEGLLYSTYHLSDKEIKDVESSISKLEKEKVELKNIVDPTLIGGVKVVVGDKVYDGSVKNKLDSLKLSLLG